MPKLAPLLKQFARDDRGVFAVVFGLMAIVLVAMGGAVVDYVSLEQARSRAQIALDAAALALQPEINDPILSEEAIRQSILERAEAIVIERIGDPRIDAEVDEIVINRDMGQLFLAGRFTMPTMFVSLVGVNTLGAHFSAEAMRGSVNLEVSIALDVTGSMEDYIDDLQTATHDLIDVILASNSDEVSARVALAPYSQAVNAGTYATALRGPEDPQRDITGIAWTHPAQNISSVTRQNSSTLTVNLTNHGLVTGEWIYITGVSSAWLTNCNVNNNYYQVGATQTHSFRITQSSTLCTGSGGQVRKCRFQNCEIEITSANHGYPVGGNIYITGVGGLSNINNTLFQIRSTSTNSLRVNAPAAAITGTYTNRTGKMDCTWHMVSSACRYYYFQSPDGNWNLFPLTTCVTERSANAFSDIAPSVTYMGRNYPPSGNPCLSNRLVPLTDNSTTLHNAVDQFAATGSTSGSLGILWGWNMLSPNFGNVWPDSRPEEYNTEELLKAAIIMTDGDFNTVHFEGAVARNSTFGSGRTRDHVNSDAHNGGPYAQAQAYCDAMKRTGIIVYTVAFNLTEGSAPATIMRNCATRPQNAYLAADGAALRNSFLQIARNISALRLTQ